MFILYSLPQYLLTVSLFLMNFVLNEVKNFITYFTYHLLLFLQESKSKLKINDGRVYEILGKIHMLLKGKMCLFLKMKCQETK